MWYSIVLLPPSKNRYRKSWVTYFGVEGILLLVLDQVQHISFYNYIVHIGVILFLLDQFIPSRVGNHFFPYLLGVNLYVSDFRKFNTLTYEILSWIWVDLSVYKFCLLNAMQYGSSFKSGSSLFIIITWSRVELLFIFWRQLSKLTGSWKLYLLWKSILWTFRMTNNALFLSIAQSTRGMIKN
jgi:hypothetical protein